MNALLLAGVCLFAWWAQRDAYAMGRERGRLEGRRDVLESLEPKPKPHLRIVR